MWIIKIGGSWITNPKLKELIDNLNNFKYTENLIIVVGGGHFTDSVRLVYQDKRLSEKTGHFLALKATEMFACLLKEINNEVSLISKIESLKKKTNKVKIWLPSLSLKKEQTFIRSWNSTSDSVAAWLHNKLDSRGLLYIKSLILNDGIYKLSNLQKKNILDKNVDRYLSKKKNIKIIGPDIIELLKDFSTWNDFFFKCKEVKV